MHRFSSKSGEWELIVVDRYGTQWSNIQKRGSFSFIRSSLKRDVNCLLDNCYFKLGNKIFGQITMIPMGSDPASFFANFSLFSYENEWIKQVKKRDIR